MDTTGKQGRLPPVWDGVALIGIGLIVFGLWQIFKPLAPIGAGCLLLLLAVSKTKVAK